MRIAALLLTLPAFTAAGQLPEADFPDFTHTDIEGNIHNLYSYLDEGKTVVIDIFATWCPNCIASIPGVEEIWETHGPNGDNTIMVLAFERDPATNNEAAFDANYNIGPPIIAEGAETVLSWGITYQPNYFVICPDRTYDMKAGAMGSNPDPILDLAVQCGTVGVANVYADTISWSLVQGQLYIEGLGEKESSFLLLDASGRQILSRNLSKGNAAVNLQWLGAGIYSARIGNSVIRFAYRAQ